MESDDAFVTRFSDGQALVHRISDEQSSLSTHSADGREVLFGAQDGNPDPFPLGALRASDDSLVQGAEVSENIGWPFELSEYAKGEMDVLVLHYDLCRRGTVGPPCPERRTATQGSGSVAAQPEPVRSAGSPSSSLQVLAVMPGTTAGHENA